MDSMGRSEAHDEGSAIGASDIASSPHAGIRIGITPLELSRWASAQVCQVVHPNVDFRSAKDRRRPFAERKATLVHITRFNLCTDRVHLSTFAPRRIPFAGAKGDDGRRPGGDPPAAAPDWLRRIGPAAGHLEPGAPSAPGYRPRAPLGPRTPGSAAGISHTQGFAASPWVSRHLHFIRWLRFR